MNEYIDSSMHKTYVVGIQDIIGQQMQAYALLMLILSSTILAYVLWNNFIRSPSKKKGIKAIIADNLDADTITQGLIMSDEGIEPSMKVKRISRALDEYIIIPSLVMFYISASYYFAIRG